MAKLSGILTMLLAVGWMTPAWADDARQTAAPVRKPFARGAARDALTGAVLGAAGGAYWGTTIGESGVVPTASSTIAGVDALSGSITGLTVAALPRKSWKGHLLAIVTGVLAN
jgi:uncharacterized membrane protein